MRAPCLNRKLVLEAQDRLSDGSGGYDILWQPLGTLWAEITARTGRETARTGATISAMGYKIVVRAAAFGAPDRPKPEQRFREGERLYLIQAVTEEDPAGHYLACFATEEAVV